MPMLEVALNLLLLVSFTIIVGTLFAALVQMVRTKRYKYLLVALAVFAWALSSWASIASGFDPLRHLLGAWTFVALIAVSQGIFIALTLAVFHFVWGWLRRSDRAED